MNIENQASAYQFTKYMSRPALCVKHYHKELVGVFPGAKSSHHRLWFELNVTALETDTTGEFSRLYINDGDVNVRLNAHAITDDPTSRYDD
jgi:hypothetical protein